jgi:acyl-CoA synthetase (AMP-forming)/AMP-acid ligase II/acyl carrier protein
LVVVPYEVSRSPKEFYKLLADEKVTVLNQTPSAFNQLIQAEENGVTEEELALRLVIFGGEALELQYLKPWFKRHGDKKPQLVNMYGITETTVHVTYRPITYEDVESGQGSVIGEPIPDLQLYVLDGNLEPVPIGVAGELYVGGAGLGRGYLNRPELTMERFIPDPFSQRPGARLYKTGDVARFLPNRDLEYLGRADQQVQIRGFRVELGEIESVLAENEAISQVVVVVREEQRADQRLVAYFVPAPDREVDIPELRTHLGARVPEYMIPQYFVELEAIPLTPNGKVDRRALPEPQVDRQAEESYVAPRNQVESAIARVWQELLNTKNVGIHDNFFELGGHSLLLVRMVVKLQETFRKELSIVEMFRHPTIAALGSFLTQKEKKEPSLRKAFDLAEKQRESLKRQKRVAAVRRKLNG